MGKQKINKKRKFGIIISSVICSVFLFSIPTYALEEPEKPVMDNFQTNAEIMNYNNQVESYNQQVDIYNSEIDKEYENELSSINKQNIEIEKHNQEEENRFNEETAHNEQAIQDAETQNELIEKQNNTNKQEVNQYNSLEDEKVLASKQVKENVEANNQQAQNDYNNAVQAEEERIAAIKTNNEKIYLREKQNIEDNKIVNETEKERIDNENAKRTATYEAELEQYNLAYENYEAELAKYEKDKKIEEQILALGYASVEDYNNKINERYNIPATTSVDENANATAVSIEDTYTIEKGTSVSGRVIPVHIEHNFMGTGISYVTDFEMDANDTITMNGIAAIGKAVIEGSCMFYYNTDGAHSMGYWANSDSYLAINPTATSDTQWINGDTHTVTYKDSTNEYQWNFEDIYMVYNYWWQALRIYKTYDTPVLPTEPTKPTLELEEFIPIEYIPDYKDIQDDTPVEIQPPIFEDVPSIYEPQYKTFIPIEYVTPELIEVLPKDIWSTLPLPIKQQHLNYLNTLERLSEPVVIENNVELVQDNVDITPARGPIILTDLRLIDTSGKKEEIEISTMELPLSNVSGSWALINLITVIINFILALILFITWLHNHNNKDSKDENIKIKHRTPIRILSLLIALGSIILFMLTENVKLPMVYIDDWTIVMVLIMIVQIVVMIFSKHKKVEENS